MRATNPKKKSAAFDHKSKPEFVLSTRETSVIRWFLKVEKYKRDSKLMGRYRQNMPIRGYQRLCLVCYKTFVDVRPRTADWQSITALKDLLYVMTPSEMRDRIKWNRITALVKIFNLPISVHLELNKNKEYLENITK